MAHTRAPRNTLSHDVIVAGAMQLADEARTVGSLTMRALAEHLGVRPMALYHHVSDKEQLLDSMVDAVFLEVHSPAADGELLPELTRRSESLREALGRHPWAIPLMESRAEPGPATLANHTAVLELLVASGFAWAEVAHAYALLDAYVYGFALTESTLDEVGLSPEADELLESMDVEPHPTLEAFAREHVLQPGYSYGASFEVGLEIMLAGIDAMPRRT
ncbi:MAG: TetR/AcrR family transcriptional regulator [Dermabacteraceae bacterium]